MCIIIITIYYILVAYNIDLMLRLFEHVKKLKINDNNKLNKCNCESW